jgi:hypothetical protein
MQISLAVLDLTKRDKEKSRLPKAWGASLELLFICSGDTENAGCSKSLSHQGVVALIGVALIG